jgi:hypothetical protein
MSKELEDSLAELVDTNPLFNRKVLGASRKDSEEMTALAFWEIGA